MGCSVGGQVALDLARYHPDEFRAVISLEPALKLDIDWPKLALRRPKMTYDLPAGGKRLVQEARGYIMTTVGGVPILEHDVPTGDGHPAAEALEQTSHRCGRIAPPARHAGTDDVVAVDDERRRAVASHVGLR